MRRIIVMVLAVLGVCMVATASASAHLFHASNTGKLLGLQTNNQVFVPQTGSLPVTCKHATTTGTVTSLLSLHQLVVVSYSECEAFLSPTTISPAEYLLSADGLAAIVNTITINVGGFGNCRQTIKPQDLGTVKYTTKGSEIIEESSVKGIVSTGSGGECGTNNTTGTYEGTNLVKLDGSPGVIGWL